MRKLATALAATMALMVGLTGTASAGVAYFTTQKICVKKRAVAATSYKVSPCYFDGKFWYFKYS